MALLRSSFEKALNSSLATVISSGVGNLGINYQICSHSYSPSAIDPEKPLTFGDVNAVLSSNLVNLGFNFVKNRNGSFFIRVMNNIHA